jgi:glutathione reductase (NADPH)
MSRYDFDFFVIGAGSGGVRASRVAARLGARVAVAEEGRLGGTCVNVGCIPKKLLVYASHYRDDFEDARGFGWTVGERTSDWPTLIANKDVEISRLNGVYRDLLEGAGVRLLPARAALLDSHTLVVDGSRYTSEFILVATGGRPHRPEVEGIEHTITSDEAFYLPQLPRRVLIVGGGYIAVEFAGILQGLGAAVTQIHRGPLFLRGFDCDVRETLAAEMRKKGIDLRFGANVERIERSDGELRAVLLDSSVVAADDILYATGRTPNTHGIGLEQVGVKIDDIGAVLVDEYSRSSVSNIFAVGDCTDRLNLTPTAIAEGQAVAETLFGKEPKVRPDHRGVPTAIFSQPPCATVGLSEEDARREHGEIDVYRTRFRPLKHTLSGRDEKTMMKLVVDRASDRVVGCHIVGADAAEIIQGFAVALKCGATKAQFDATIGIHPTSAEELVQMRDRVPETR